MTDAGQFDQAQTEIHIFEKDFRIDAPITRLKIELLVARATETSGLMAVDRIAILEQASDLAQSGIKKHSYAKGVFAVYCEVGLRLFKLDGSREVFDDAIKQLKAAEQRLVDPDISSIIRRYERLEASLSLGNSLDKEAN